MTHSDMIARQTQLTQSKLIARIAKGLRELDDRVLKLEGNATKPQSL